MKIIIFIIFFINLSFSHTLDESFDSAVIVQIKKSEKLYICSGVFISSKTILTAGHCLDGEVQSLKIFLSKFNSHQNNYLKVKYFQIHPDYNSDLSKYNADLGKIELEKPINETLNIYPFSDEKKFKGKYFRIGFGNRERKNKLAIIPLEFKKDLIKSKCLVFYDNDSKAGDSGGPIFKMDNNKISLVAIHSTLSFGPLGTYSFNPKTISFLDWINENQNL